MLRNYRTELRAPQLACFPGDHIGDQLIAHGYYEGQSLSLIFDKLLASRYESFRTQVAVDIGANVGNHSFFFSRRFKRVLTVEPSPVSSLLLEASILQSGVENIELIRTAVGDAPGDATYYLNSGDNIGMSGISAYVAESLSVKSLKTMQVPVVRADALIEERINGDVVGLVKIDIEGHEAAALRGLSKTLSVHRPIVLFEHHPHLTDDSPIDELRRAGYRDFYYVSHSTGLRRNRMLELARRLMSSSRLEIVRLPDILEQRAYEMIIAAPEPLD